MPIPLFSYTKVLHKSTYAEISPSLPALSTQGKVVLITGATGGIGRSTALSFAASKPKALILLARNAEELGNTKKLVEASQEDVVVQTHVADLCDATAVRQAFDKVVAEFGKIDIFVHSAGVLAPTNLLLEADPATFIDGYKTTVVGTLVVAQALVLANKKAMEPEKFNHPDFSITFINLTTAGILYPPIPGMGAYVSSKMAAVKLLEAFSRENTCIRLHHVHPGFINTNMSKTLSTTINLDMPYDDVSLPSDFLVWIASPQAEFLKGKIVFAPWDVTELIQRKEEIAKNFGDLEIGFRGFPRYMGNDVVVTV